MKKTAIAASSADDPARAFFAMIPPTPSATAPRRGTVERAFQPPVRPVERFGENLRSAGHGHEIRVPVPPRDDVPVKMTQHARSRRTADVHAKVEPVRPVLLPEGPLDSAKP